MRYAGFDFTAPRFISCMIRKDACDRVFLIGRARPPGAPFSEITIEKLSRRFARRSRRSTRIGRPSNRLRTRSLGACKNFRMQAFDCYLKAKPKTPGGIFETRRFESNQAKRFRLSRPKKQSA